MMTNSAMLGLMDLMMQVLLLLPLEMRQHLKAMTRILVRVTMEVVKKEPHSRMRGLLILVLQMMLESIPNLEQHLMMGLQKPLLVEKRTRKEPRSTNLELSILELLMKLESIQNLEQRLMMELRKPLIVEKRTRRDFPIQSSEMLVKMKILDRVMMEIEFQLQDE